MESLRRRKQANSGVSAVAAEHEDAAGKDCDARTTQQLDGVAIGELHGLRCGLHVVAALGAALGVQDRTGGTGDDKGRTQSQLHWKNSSSTKSTIHSAPMACQYQAVVSTMIWREASCREVRRPTSAPIRAAMPRNRWMA